VQERQTVNGFLKLVNLVTDWYILCRAFEDRRAKECQLGFFYPDEAVENR